MLYFLLLLLFCLFCCGGYGGCVGCGGCGGCGGFVSCGGYGGLCSGGGWYSKQWALTICSGLKIYVVICYCTVLSCWEIDSCLRHEKRKLIFQCP